MDLEKIKKQTNKIGKNFMYYHELTSTQELAKELAMQKVEDGTVIFAEVQTNGKGTKGRSWYTGEGKNIAMTIIQYPDCTIDQLEGITIQIAEAIQQAIWDLYGYRLTIKEPNDLLKKKKKDLWYFNANYYIGK